MTTTLYFSSRRTSTVVPSGLVTSTSYVAPFSLSRSTLLAVPPPVASRAAAVAAIGLLAGCTAGSPLRRRRSSATATPPPVDGQRRRRRRLLRPQRACSCLLLRRCVPPSCAEVAEASLKATAGQPAFSGHSARGETMRSCGSWSSRTTSSVAARAAARPRGRGVRRRRRARRHRGRVVRQRERLRRDGAGRHAARARRRRALRPAARVPATGRRS